MMRAQAEIGQGLHQGGRGNPTGRAAAMAMAGVAAMVKVTADAFLVAVDVSS